jgi:hypothetical protein
VHRLQRLPGRQCLHRRHVHAYVWARDGMMVVCTYAEPLGKRVQRAARAFTALRTAVLRALSARATACRLLARPAARAAMASTVWTAPLRRTPAPVRTHGARPCACLTMTDAAPPLYRLRDVPGRLQVRQRRVHRCVISLHLCLYRAYTHWVVVLVTTVCPADTFSNAAGSSFCTCTFGPLAESWIVSHTLT